MCMSRHVQPPKSKPQSFLHVRIQILTINSVGTIDPFVTFLFFPILQNDLSSYNSAPTLYDLDPSFLKGLAIKPITPPTQLSSPWSLILYNTQLQKSLNSLSWLFFDVSAALDMVDHDILPQQLEISCVLNSPFCSGSDPTYMYLIVPI